MILPPRKAPLLEGSVKGSASPIPTSARREHAFVGTVHERVTTAAILIPFIGLISVQASLARDLNDPELVYTYISRAFPGTVEHAGGLSSAISLVEIICHFSNTREIGRVALEARCWARAAPEGAMMSATGDVKDLILGLINAGLALDRQAEPGTTYLVARGLECIRHECKSPDPTECAGVEVSYECSTD